MKICNPAMASWKCCPAAVKCYLVALTQQGHALGEVRAGDMSILVVLAQRMKPSQKVTGRYCYCTDI